MNRRLICRLRIAVVALLLSATVLWTNGATAVAATTKPKSGGSVTLSVASDNSGLIDAVRGVGGNTYGVILTSVYDSLVLVNPATLKVIPRLATSVTPNATNTVWTIKLRSGVKFSYGTPFDANAVKAQWDRLNNPATGAAATVKGELAGATWAVQDPQTIVVTLAQANGAFITFLGAIDGQSGHLGLIPSPTAVAKAGATYGTTPSTIVGAGAFTVKDKLVNDHVTVVRNPTYWDAPKPYLDQITFKIIGDPNTVRDALQSNTIQGGVFGAPAPDTTQPLLASKNFKTASVLINAAYGATFNQSKAPLDDVRVRQALTLAADCANISAKAQGNLEPLGCGGGKGVAAFPKSSPYFDPSVASPKPDLAKAQKLIDDYVAQKGPVNITVLIPDALTTLGNALVQSWSRLKNANIVANVQSSSQTVTLINTSSYQIVVSQTTGPYYVNTLYTALHTGQPGNLNKVANPEIDALLDAGRQYSDVPHTKTYLNKIFKILLTQEFEYVRVYFALSTFMVHKSIQGNDPAVLAEYSDPAAMWTSSK